jgi:hypothetical protein
MPKYPEIEVGLIGEDGNAFHILGKTKKAMKKHGLPEQEIDKYYNEATNGDYDNLLRTTMKWVTIV